MIVAEVLCRHCFAVIEIGVDAHDDSIDDMGRELFVCEACCQTCRRR